MSGTHLVLATRNRHKVVELQHILADAGVSTKLSTVDAFAGVPEVAETGLTFSENALLKAHAVAAASGLPAVADDSGLCVDAMNGMPGVFSARWAGRHGDDEANLRLLLDQIVDVPDEHRGGRFACAAALALPDGTARVVEGILAGTIIREPRGRHGFGYDPIFVPEGMTVTTAQLPPEEKNAISHRARAFHALAPYIAELTENAKPDSLEE